MLKKLVSLEVQAHPVAIGDFKYSYIGTPGDQREKFFRVQQNFVFQCPPALGQAKFFPRPLLVGSLIQGFMSNQGRFLQIGIVGIL